MSAMPRKQKQNLIEDVRLDDLRHTVGTYAGQVRRKRLSRARSIAAQEPRYDRPLREPRRRPVRTLSDQVGERIAADLAGQNSGEVVALRRGAA